MKPYRSPGHMPVLNYLVRDLFVFRRAGYSWAMSWRSALGYWHFDRAA